MASATCQSRELFPREKQRSRPYLHTPSPGAPTEDSSVGATFGHVALSLLIEILVMPAGQKRKTLAEEGMYFKMTQFIFGDWDYALWETRKKRKPD